MRARILPLLFLLLCCFASQAQADMWEDPSWEEMITRPDLIARVRVIEGGVFVARVKPVKVFKGKASSGNFHITNFSNRYGPYDTLRAGEEYYLFLFRADAEREKRTTPSTDAARAFQQAATRGEAFYVYTPTAGDLPVIKGKVLYDLLQTSPYRGMKGRNLKEFEEFLGKALHPPADRKYLEKLAAKLRRALRDSSDEAAQSLMMLHLAGNRKMLPEFERAMAHGAPETRYALARHLGGLDTADATGMLARLMDDPHPMVQSEAVRQISDGDPERVGPILLKKLSAVSNQGSPPRNIMDPVTNRIDGAKLEIVRAFGEMNYRPAIDSLLPLLATQDERLFNTTLDVLRGMDAEGILPYLIEHIDDRDEELLLTICNAIEDDTLVGAKEALKEYLLSRPIHQLNYGFVAGTLASFGDPETEWFLIGQLRTLISPFQELAEAERTDGIADMIDIFASHGVAAARPAVYDAIYYFTGIDSSFAEDDALFARKQALEDSVRAQVLRRLAGEPVAEVRVLAFTHETPVEPDDPALLSRGAYIVMIEAGGEEIDTLYEAEESSPNSIFDRLKALFDKAERVLGIPGQRISVAYKEYMFHVDRRFDTLFGSMPVARFFEYARKVGDRRDLALLRAMERYRIVKSEMELSGLRREIEMMEERLAGE